jgi:hypothetical protein
MASPSLSDPDHQCMSMVRWRQAIRIRIHNMNYGQMALSLSDPDLQYMNYGQIEPSLSDPDQPYGICHI